MFQWLRVKKMIRSQQWRLGRAKKGWRLAAGNFEDWGSCKSNKESVSRRRKG